MSTAVKNMLVILLTLVAMNSMSFSYANIMLNKESSEVLFNEEYIDLSKYQSFIEKHKLDTKDKSLSFEPTGEATSPVLENKIQELRELIAGNEIPEGDNLVDLTEKLKEEVNKEEVNKQQMVDEVQEEKQQQQ